MRFKYDTSDLLKLSEDITGDGPQVSFVPQTPSTLKRPPKHGVCLWWSDRQPSWIHPDDVEKADVMIPGDRVFRRDECENFADRELGFSQSNLSMENAIRSWPRYRKLNGTGCIDG